MFVCICLFSSQYIFSQCNLPFPPTIIFEEPPLLCEGLDMFCSELPNQYTQQELPGCDIDEFQIHNGHLLKFIAGSSHIRLRITPSFCEFNPNGTGVQAAIYEGVHPFLEDAFLLIANCGEGNEEDILIESNLFIVGCIYYLLVDGWSASPCSYEIIEEAGSTAANVFVPAPTISGPSIVCDEESVTYHVFGDACTFDWNISGGTYDTTETGGYIEVDIIDAASFTICVTATNGCYESEETCFTTENMELTEKDSLIMDEICIGSDYHFFDQVLTEAGEYIDSTVIECERIIFHLTLGEAEGTQSTDSLTICPGDCINYDGEEYCEEGVYEIIETGINGCDSTITLTIIELPNGESSFSDEFCPASPYVWNNMTYAQPGVYEQTLSTVEGCDSVVTLTLSLTIIQNSVGGTICQGENFVYNGTAYTSETHITDEYTSFEGCDSIVMFDLFVLPKPNYDTLATICEMDSFVLGPHVLYDAGFYQLEIPSTVSCDTTVFVELMVIPVFMEQVDEIICEGDSLEYGGDFYSIAGNYTMYKEGGCDSIITLDLSYYPNMDVAVDTVIAVGETYNGVVITGDTTFVEVVVDINGCLATLTTNVKIIVANVEIESGFVFQLFPNPASQVVYIESQLFEEFVSLDIVNIRGQLECRVEISEIDDKNILAIDISTLATGVFFVIATTKNERFVRKLIVLNTDK